MEKVVIPPTGMNQQAIAYINAYINNHQHKGEGVVLEIKSVHEMKQVKGGFWRSLFKRKQSKYIRG